jgi:UDPglucose 6-dehydrogenase
MARAGELGASEALTFLREVDSINMRRRTRAVELARQHCGSLLGARVAVLGAAFKPDSDDVRDSPALNIAGQMQLQGAAVSVYDPKAIENSRALFPTLGYATSVEEACERADLTMILTEWDEFLSLDPHSLGTIVNHKKIIDARNCLIPSVWRGAGWAYTGFGRASE